MLRLAQRVIKTTMLKAPEEIGSPAYMISYSRVTKSSFHQVSFLRSSSTSCGQRSGLSRSGLSMVGLTLREAQSAPRSIQADRATAARVRNRLEYIPRACARFHHHSKFIAC